MLFWISPSLSSCAQFLLSAVIGSSCVPLSGIRGLWDGLFDLSLIIWLCPWQKDPKSSLVLYPICFLLQTHSPWVMVTFCGVLFSLLGGVQLRNNSFEYEYWGSQSTRNIDFTSLKKIAYIFLKCTWFLQKISDKCSLKSAVIVPFIL